MTQSKPPMNLLLVGDNQPRMQLLNDSLRQQLPQAKTNRCSSLRIGSPDAPLQNLTALILQWENNPMADWRHILAQDSPSRRSFEGIVWKIANTYGEKLLRRTAILATGLSQEEVYFLAEFNIRCVQTMTPDPMRWKSELAVFAKKIAKMISDEESGGNSLADCAIRRFEMALERWSKIDEFQKMYLCDNLRRYFGDSATYDELMSRKAAAENNPSKAEQLLCQCLLKNPNHVRAQQTLADMYMSRGLFREALKLYLELHRKNPRHPGRATKIAECYLKLGNLEEADNACSQALSLDEHAMETRGNLAITRIALGDYDSAKSLLKGGGSAADLATYLNSIGIQMVKSGRFPESIDHYKKALLVLPSNSHRHLLFLNIGLAYAKLGKVSEARQFARLALARQPQYQKAIQLLKALGDTGPSGEQVKDV